MNKAVEIAALYTVGVLLSSHIFTFPCLIGFLCARYWKRKMSFYFYYAGVLLWSVTWICKPTFFLNYSGWYGFFFTMECGAFGIATLIFYYRAIKAENRRRKMTKGGSEGYD